MEEPNYIVVEGIDGSSKTTIINHIVDLFNKANKPIISTKGVGGSTIGLAVRERLLSNQKVDSTLEVLGMLTANIETIVDIVEPNLAKGITVISDRSIASLLAYQDWGREIDVTAPLIHILTGTTVFTKLNPDLYIYCDVDIDVAEQRTKGRGDENHYDIETRAFKERVKKGYKHVFNSGFCDNSIRLNTNVPLEEVLANVTELMQEYLK